MLRYALCYSPSFIRNKVESSRSKKQLAHWMEISNRTKISKEQVSEIIDILPIDGKDVLLHTSLLKIGKVKGGAKWVCECFLNKMDLDNQTLMVSALPFQGRVINYLKTLKEFDVRTAPVAMGAVNERIAEMQEAKRSVHPTHSIVAIGKDAEYYTSEHFKDVTPFGIHSPYYRLIERRGKVVLFGTGINSLTLVHVCEDLLGDYCPNKIYTKKVYKIPCINENGETVVVSTRSHNPLCSIGRDLEPFVQGLKDEGIVVSYVIGESDVIVLDAYSFVVYYLKKMKEGVTMYGKIKVSKSLEGKIDSILDIL